MNVRRLLSILATLVVIGAMAGAVHAQDNTVKVTDHDTYGEILTDADGMTLYVFGNDSENESACTEGCAEAWPPLTVEADTEPTAGSGVTGSLDTFEREDGSMQVSYNGMPLYTFAQDAAAGDTEGQGAADNWYVVPVGATSFSEAEEMSEEARMMAEGEAEATATDSDAMAADATATPAADDGADQPESLPQTGATQSLPMNSVVLMAAGLLAIMLGIGYRRARAEDV